MTGPKLVRACGFGPRRQAPRGEGPEPMIKSGRWPRDADRLLRVTRENSVTTSVAAQADPRTEVRLLRRGRRIKADIKLVSWGGAEAILKDFADRPWPVRLVGRLQIGREVRALARLRGIPGVPACYGRWGRHGLLIETMRGERITRWCQGRTQGVASMFRRLDRLVGAMHARGVIH